MQVASADGGEVLPVNRTLISAGYKPVTIKGTVYYCRTVDVTNTNFNSSVTVLDLSIAE